MNRPESGTLARLSESALRAAEAARLDDVQAAAKFLYQFNCLCPTESWQRRYCDPESTAEALGLDREAEGWSRLRESWLEAPGESTPGWRSWTARLRGDELGGRGPGFKLYVSPAMESIRASVQALVRGLSLRRALSFKVGADAAGLLRPDKIVVYFADLEDLAAVAHELQDRLQGAAAQGVPFTSEIGSNGLLSWSVDPPHSAAMKLGPRPSWRSWITRRAAVALVAAQRRRDSESAPWLQTLEQLRREGVDVERWRPATGLWNSPGAWR